jgi:SAM-dependent methyltransferase
MTATKDRGEITWPLDLIACPACTAPLDIGGETGDGICPSCGNPFRRLEYGWEFLPPRDEERATLWQTWDQLQENGVVSYEADPENNTAVGPREDARAFARFADLRGRVLDVGCGPQPRPAYFAHEAPGTAFLGIDPLVGDRPAEYPQVRGLAENLPFRDEAFDRVLFATTLDHFVDPVAALLEAERVRRTDGAIVVWLGHKDPAAPPPEVSQAWYDALETPAGAEDVFHIKRLGPGEAEDLFSRAGLDVVASEAHRVDDYRSNHFFRLVAGAR